jgi:hypothetical protein
MRFLEGVAGIGGSWLRLFMRRNIPILCAGFCAATPLDVKQTPAGLEIALPEKLDPLATVIELDVQGPIRTIAK